MDDARTSAAPPVLAALLVLGAAAHAATFEQSTWERTIYYRAAFTSPGPGDAVLRVAAADSYEVFLNGARVGADSVATQAGRFEVALAGGDNDLAVRVANRGTGAGNGLLLSLEGAEAQVATTTNRLVTAWYWTASPQPGTAWTTAAVEADTAWRFAQRGNLDTAAIAGLPESVPEAIAGLPGDVDTGSRSGAVVLADIGGRNLALLKPSNHPEVVDGNTAVSWDAPTNALNFYASVDLQRRHHVSQVRLVTRGRTEAELERNSLRGYSVQISDDQIRWTEVGVLHDIDQYAWTQVAFTPAWTRYLRAVIVDIDPTTSPRLGELEVFGEGHAETGSLRSAILDLGVPGGAKNLGRITWDADVPKRTELSVRLRSGDTAEAFADPDAGWSRPLAAGDVWSPAAEPARLFQYRVDMVTHDDRRTPELRSLGLDFSTDIAVSAAAARVAPNDVEMGVDTTFTYTLDLAFGAGDLGVSRLEIEVPSEARLDEGAPVAALLSGWASTQETLTLEFAAPLRTTGTLVIPFRARTYASAHDFRAYAYHEGGDNPLNVAQNTELDPDGVAPYSWSVRTTTSRGDVLSQVRANPPVLTPNGDGINDGSVIEFILAKVDTPRRVDIRIYDLSGRLVRSLDPPHLAAGVYQRLSSGTGAGSPGYWDGTDAAGHLVPPGVYAFEVRVGLDRQDEVRAGTLGVAY